ncbi:Origin of replication binding protein [uncultured virus]|nr:Origin of replication binding protein [uncultured virus]
MSDIIAIHEHSSRINHFNMDGIEIATQSPSNLNNETTSTPQQGAPINTSPNLYTTSPNIKVTEKIQANQDEYPVYHDKSKDVFYKYGRKFYYFLVDQNNGRKFLKGCEPVTDNSLILFLNDGVNKGYTIWHNYNDFLSHYSQIPELHRNFFEVINGPQKPHFDLDAEIKNFKDPSKLVANAEVARDAVIWGVNEVLHEHGVNYSQDLSLLVTESNGPNKQSYHIIVDNWIHDDHTKAEAFYYLVMDKIKGKYNPEVIIDPSVYKPNQQFRLLGSQKSGSNRPKYPVTAISRKRDPTIYAPADNILAHLVGFTSGCERLPAFTYDKTQNKVNRKIQHKQQTRTITTSEEKQAIHFFSLQPCYNQYRKSTSFVEGLIGFDRIPGKSGKCICCRHPKDHTSVGCFLTIDNYGNVRFHCHSKNPPDQNIIIGNIYRDDGDINHNNTDSDDDTTDDNDVCNFMGDYCLKHGELCPQQQSQPKQLQQLQQLPKRVQAHPITMGDIINNKVIASVYDGFTSGETNYINNGPIINKEDKNNNNNNTNNTNMKDNEGQIIYQTKTYNNYVSPVDNEGQIISPSFTTSVASFLNGNNKYIGGYKYTVKVLFDAYNNYRCGKGAKYSIEGGSFSKALTALGHYIQQERIKGSKDDRVRVVTLKRPEPIVITNPVETLKLVQDNIHNITNVATNFNNNQAKELLQDLRPLDQNIDIRNFMDEYLIEDPDATVDFDNLYLCFVHYCSINRIKLVRFKRGRLMHYFKKWLIRDADNLVIKGWKCKIDMELMNNEAKEKTYRKIWYWNTAPYTIGWHNGKNRERYDKTMTKEWKKIDVHHCCDENIKPINALIEMTKSFEKSLPDRVKAIKHKIMELSFFPYNGDIKKEIDRLQLGIITNALVNDKLKNGTEDTVLTDEDNKIKTRIEELRRESDRLVREERERLKESIKDDIARLRDGASWCIAVRSTFASGKTVNLKPFIEAFPEMKVLIVLPRVSLTDDYMREYREMGFEIYNEIKHKGEIRGNRIIVCYPSIRRVKGQFDLLVLDEYKVLKDLQHTLVSKNNKNFRKKNKERGCYEALCQYVASTKKVYIADALLTNAHVSEIARMRKKSEHNKRVTVYQNLFQKHVGKEVYTVDNQNLLINMIIKFLREGLRVVVPTNSKAFAEILNKQIIDSGLNVTISLSTGEQRATVPISELWTNKSCIIYTPTILAGNSYTAQIDVICGYFTTASCDQADALQMLMRARNNTSNKYYVCVEKGHGLTSVGALVPKYVHLSSESIKQYLISISTESRLKNEMKRWAEEYNLPVDIVKYDYINDTIKENDAYFNSYVNYVKQCVIKEREYLFRMLLYMRDCGFSYGGNVYMKTDDKEAVEVIKEAKKQWTKERREENLELECSCGDISGAEYVQLKKKVNKTKDDRRRMKKYRLEKCYRVDNVPKWFLKVVNNKYTQYANIRRFERLNGVIDQKRRYELMGEIGRKFIASYDTTPTNNEENEQNDEDYDATDDIRVTNKAQTNNLCWHALNILKIIGAENYIRDVPRFDVNSGEFTISHLNDYIVQNEHQIRTIVNDFKTEIKDEINVENDTETPNRILSEPLKKGTIKLASKVTNKAFGIKFKSDVLGYMINNMWIVVNPGTIMYQDQLIRYDNNLIWPFNHDVNDKEELKVYKGDVRQEILLNWTKNRLARTETDIIGSGGSTLIRPATLSLNIIKE